MKALRRASQSVKDLRANEDYRNFRQANHCSLSFFGIYTAVYSAQNLQGTLFDHAGYGPLGLISNSIAYVGQGIGSIFCVYYLQRIGCIKSMGWGSVLSLPSIIALILPTLAYYYQDSTNILFSSYLVYIVTIAASFLNGFGEGISQPASGNYISDCATEKSKGFFFAYFWAFYMGS